MFINILQKFNYINNIIDMTSTVRSNINLDEQNNLHLVINKIEKRLFELLDAWQVQEIIPTAQLEPNKIRVIETRPANDIRPPGTIIEVCRKGYQRGEQIIRPVDVITSKFTSGS